MARRFGTVSWAALAVLVVTGIAQVEELGISWTDGTLGLKLALVAIATGLAAVHQFTARRTSPVVRGVIQGLVLVASLAVFAVAVTL